MTASVPHWKPGATVTAHATVAVAGGRCVAIAGPRVGGNPAVAYPAAGGRVAGVTSVDKPAGAKVMIYRDGVLDVEAGAAITAGQELEADAQGRVIPLAAGVKVGVAWDDAANGARVPVAFDPA